MAGGAALVEEEQAPTLRLRQATREQVIGALDDQEAHGYQGLDLSLLSCELDEDLADAVITFCGNLRGEGVLRVAHSDLGSGTECEQRIYDLKAQRQAAEKEKGFYVKMKADSSKEKDFAVSAGKRRKGAEGIEAADAKLAAVDEESVRLDAQKATTQWYKLFKTLEAAPQFGSLSCLELPDCGLSSTALEHLTHAILEQEQRAAGARITRLVLDGNDLGDSGMGPLASLLRLSSNIEALHLRNVGITETGVSQVISGLVSNKSLRLLDLRNNGCASLEFVKAAVSGVMRFNKTVQILLE
mmetsp:Transcript_32964/g.87113  ORF Transcript_32964/g.87113 Transcript_32964/m.87113 type:complete len:300 (+) Transcript_32964:58-957(+)